MNIDYNNLCLINKDEDDKGSWHLNSEDQIVNSTA